MKVAKKLKSQSGDVSGYANDSNPFGDSNLNEKWVAIYSLINLYIDYVVFFKFRWVLHSLPFGVSLDT